MAGKMHREDSSVQRQVIYQASFILIREHPLMGIGVGGFMPAMADLGLAEPGATINGKRVMIHSIHLHAHNIILECWLERGLLGVFALGWFAILAIRRSVTLLRPTSNQSMIALAGMAAVIALAVQMVADYTLWDAPVMITTWLVVGLAFTHSAGSVKA
jgi:O-antigen ligase